MSTPSDLSHSNDLANELLASLRKDLGSSSAVSGLMLLPLIKRAADLQQDIQALHEALQADAAEAAKAG